MTSTAVWTDRPNLSDLDGFWTAPIAQRAAGFAALREREPVPFFEEPSFAYFKTGQGYWALTRHADVVEASRNPAVFVSGSGSTSLADMPPEFREYFGSMIEMDDPRHARLRRIVSRGFTPKRLSDLMDDVSGTARAIVDDVIDKGECDAVTEISARLPLKIVCDLMGVPESQYQFVFDQSNIVLGASDPRVRARRREHRDGTAAGGARAHRADGRPRPFAHREPDGRRRIGTGQRRGRRGEAHPGGTRELLHPARGGSNETTRNAISWGVAAAHGESRAARHLAGRPRRGSPRRRSRRSSGWHRR